MDVRDKIFIGGEWVPSKGSGTIEVINSATEEVMGTIPKAPRKMSISPPGPLPTRSTTGRRHRSTSVRRR